MKRNVLNVPIMHLLLAIVGLIVLVFYTQGIFSKEAPPYEVVHEFLDLLEESREVKFIDARVHKFNRTQAVLTLSFNATSELVNNYTVWIDGYERYGIDHTYQKSAITHAIPLCQFMKNKVLFSVRNPADTNFPTVCPLKPGMYFIRNHVFEQSRGLPKEIPGTFWRFDVKGAMEEHKPSNFFFLQYYVKIVRPTSSPTKIVPAASRIN